MKPPALFDAQGRKRLARLLVWGDSVMYSRYQIEARIEHALARIAAALEDIDVRGDIQLEDLVAAVEEKRAALK